MPSIVEPKFSEISQQLLKEAVAQGADAADVVIRQERGFAAVARAGDIEHLEHHQEKSLVITVYANQCTGSASASDFSKGSIKETLEKALSIAKFTGSDEYAGLAEKDSQAFDYPDLDLHHEWSVTPSDAVELAIACETTAREQDAAITDAEGATVSSYEAYFVYANSNGFSGGYPSTRHSIYSEVVAERDGQMQRDMEYSTARDPSELLDPILIAKKAAAKTLQRLGARKIATQKCPVIFHADVARGLLGSFLSAISGSNLYRKSSFLLDCIDQPVFPSHISLMQHPHLIKGLGSAAFDNEGVKTCEQSYVEDGILTRYALGSYSARKLSLQSTGNAGGVFNLMVTHDDINLQALLKKMDTGLLVTELMGQGINILTGDYSRGVAGYWVEKGEIQYPVHEITIAGNLKEMFMDVVTVANDVDRRGRIQTGSILLEKMMIAGE